MVGLTEGEVVGPQEAAKRRPLTRSARDMDTPNQIVAYNLAEPAAAKTGRKRRPPQTLAPYVGARWSKATFSSAERSVDGHRVRQFTADEIVAFSRCFDVRSATSSCPPRPSQSETPVRLATARTRPRAPARRADRRDLR